jgi:uncharacterized protein (DUF305 family)
LKTLLTKAWLLALLLTVASLLAACGSTGGGHQGSESADDGEQGTAEKSGGMAGMDHSNMDHGSMGMGLDGMARQMVMENGKYSDRAFIDAMVPHHQGAVDMAQVALEQTENPEIKELAGNIVSAQQREIEQMRQWRQAWYPED